MIWESIPHNSTQHPLGKFELFTCLGGAQVEGSGVQCLPQAPGPSSYTADDINPALLLRPLNYGNVGEFRIMGNAP